jgi:CheY-like chemotaxis protein
VVASIQSGAALAYIPVRQSDKRFTTEKPRLPARSQADGRPEAALDLAMKLLIVENNPAVRQVIKTIVGALADDVYECEDGGAALAAYQTHHPDVTLMDIELGQVDGITATRQITAADPAAYVIIVTNYDETDLREAARQAGARGYVLKENLFEILPLLASL